MCQIKRYCISISIVVLSILSCPHLIAGSGALIPFKAKSAPMIDGQLNDSIWMNNPFIEKEFTSYHPSDGVVLPQKTKVWVAYDDENIYFAFYCYDTDPDKIKTTVAKRDSIFSDDWVGVGLDTIGSRQGIYEFIVNPSGIQCDAMMSASGGEDFSVDWVWYSAGSKVEDGYVVEIKVPLKSIRYKSGDDVEMGIIFFRKISREGISGAWPELPPGKGWLNCMEDLKFENLKSHMKLEVLPSITSGSLWDRQSPNSWSTADTANELGISAKLGLTSTITAEVTYNPDFSQVESDSFQVMVNQRYPIYNQEKRPFFMEVGNIFNLAGAGGESYMWKAVHSRKIVNPEWGTKVTGEVGNTSFAVLAAGDEWAGRVFDDDEDDPNFYEGLQATYMMGRLKYGLGGDNYVGLIYTDKEIGDYSNRTIGGDFQFKFQENHTLMGNFMYSFTDDPEEGDTPQGDAYHLQYFYYSKPLGAFLQYEHFDEGFRMDTAFIQRTGVTKTSAWFAPQWYPNEDFIPWLKKVRTFLFGFYTYDHTTDMEDYYMQAVLALFTTKQGWFRLDYQLHHESWEGTGYDKYFMRAMGRMQLTQWLSFFFWSKYGDALYYEEEGHFMGNSFALDAELTIQPNAQLTQYFSYTYEDLENPATGLDEYTINILQSRTTYQFNENLLVRALLQYDSYRELFLTDLLVSFTLIPGTVMHLGYGSLHENLEWQNNEWLDDTAYGNYFQRSQSLFFKVSYLFSF